MDAMKMDVDAQVELLMQGTEYGDDTLRAAMAGELRERLLEAEREQRPLRVYCGYDPRTTDLHLGHTITMRKLRQFQDLGHQVTFLIGSYTALIGDPSEKDKLRPRLTPEQVEINGRSYAEQAFRVLDREKTIVRFNGEWLSQLTFARLIELASNFTLQQFLTRENFHLRWEKGDPVYLHETFYSIMQGYDAFMLQADVQVGGTEQLFNIMTAARKIMVSLGAKPNIAIPVDILPGTDGVIRMSKSLGNHIPLNTTAEDMFGKVMSLPDFVMPKYFRLVTRWTPVEIDALEAALNSGQMHPREAKVRLAHEIVSILFSEPQAAQAASVFERTFVAHEIPEAMPESCLPAGLSLVEALTGTGLATSRGEARRLIAQRGVRLDGQVVEDPQQPILQDAVLQVGRRKFVRIRVERR